MTFETIYKPTQWFNRKEIKHIREHGNLITMKEALKHAQQIRCCLPTANQVQGLNDFIAFYHQSNGYNLQRWRQKDPRYAAIKKHIDKFVKAGLLTFDRDERRYDVKGSTLHHHNTDGSTLCGRTGDWKENKNGWCVACMKEFNRRMKETGISQLMNRAAKELR